MTLTAPDLAQLGAALATDLRHRGFGSQLIPPADGRYDGARHIWNGAVDRRPALVAQCATPHDVALAIGLARDHQLPLAVRGGGHSIPGHSVCDGGVVVDLSPMRHVSVDAATRSVRAGGGALLEDLARAGTHHGLVVPGGHISHTGVGGITTGGGIGWLHRRFGLTIDCLRSVQVVTADGSVVEADQDRNADLFWGVRGGGGNFGVVTEFRFEGRPLGPTVLAGMMAFEAERAPEVIAAVQSLEDEELTLWQVFATAPPAPPFPDHMHGRPMLVLAFVWAGPETGGERAAAQLRAMRPALDLVGPMPYLATQFMIDDTAPPGLASYGRSHWLSGVDGIAEAMLDAYQGVTAPLGSIILGRMGGAVERVDPAATAFAHRDAHSVLWIVNSWSPEDDPERHMAWVRAVSDAAAPWATGGVYVNALDRDEGGRIGAAYPPETWERLVDVKNAWDPENVFRLNQNIPPSGY